MRTSLRDLLATGRVLLADGATGTNYFQRGLESGDPPELWNVDCPDRVQGLHREFVEAGADIILTNTFGGNRHRLKLHHHEHRVHELNKLAAELAGQIAEPADRPVVVAGSVGPTGELFEPLGALTEAEAVDAFTEQANGLKAGGADVIWIETMSSAEEVRAAAMGAINAGMPYTATLSFDTAGRTMMGILPGDIRAVFDGLPEPPVAMGANCGVGASDILVSLLEMTAHAHDSPDAHDTVYISKGNCGVPRFVGTEAVYTGTPELMADYARLAVHAGARIVGGCCGTSPKHLAFMRLALDTCPPGERPQLDEIVTATGPLCNAAPTATGEGRERRRRRGSD
jgi:5-methyltetrahydrofolate--homocysteine methyltransferase